ncbi:hypothetical protein SLH49_04885 [Cognatiyoonia sp. IB215446]|uniref:hypothetical protein n=1 Tax=Cognatiyoonia sp. IB215446 TaxID=3097355 RepID=UPI002A163A9C|nr:hypothetical protein [Cognatiyoonia sp. IB215446]MDX8347317.1 hypothetical protein [Cognatiyoonia sp. IB215446]
MNLKEANFTFSHSPHFSEENRELFEQHYDRLKGTLVFWKNNAAKYGNFHHYCVAWTILGGISIPFLAQAITGDPFSKWSLTIVSAHVAVLYVSQKGFKVEQNYKSFRLGESEFYDLRRRLLDMPHKLGENESDQIKNYFEQVEAIRSDMRLREVDGIASFEDLRQAVQQSRNNDPTGNP